MSERRSIGEDRIRATLESLGIDSRLFEMRFPPALDDLDQARRVVWDAYYNQWHLGAVWPVSDVWLELFDRGEIGIFFNRQVALQFLIAGHPARDTLWWALTNYQLGFDGPIWWQLVRSYAYTLCGRWQLWKVRHRVTWKMRLYRWRVTRHWYTKWLMRSE